MNRPLDLNRLREEILENQRRNTPQPTRIDEKVFVDRSGRIALGSDAPDGEQRALSEVHQGLFAAGRAAAEATAVAARFPAGTEPLTVDGISGWLYSLTSELGDPFRMFAYWDGSMYQVKLVEPALEGRYSPHHGHVYSDGRLCLSTVGGMPDLVGAYAKSALWATGFGVFTRTGQFPFNR